MRWTRQLVMQLALSAGFRFACYGVMLWLALVNEGRAAPHLPDLVLEVVPYVEWVDRWNYVLWLVAYVPVAVALLVIEPTRFVRYMVASGVLALVRGLCIVVTGLGPVHGADVHAGQTLATWPGFARLVLPHEFFADTGARVTLTKDLFFSGHTATTFLLLLYVWRVPRLRWPMLGAHLLVVASVFLAHLHYTIDVLGAYFATVTVFVAFERLAARRSP